MTAFLIGAAAIIYLLIHTATMREWSEDGAK